METPQSGDHGYPEEQPREVAEETDSGQGPREGADTADADRAPDNEEGTATGNRDAAGASE